MQNDIIAKPLNSPHPHTGVRDSEGPVEASRPSEPVGQRAADTNRPNQPEPPVAEQQKQAGSADQNQSAEQPRASLSVPPSNTNHNLGIIVFAVVMFISLSGLAVYATLSTRGRASSNERNAVNAADYR